MKVARHLSVAILVVLCLAALYGSYYLITDPSGYSLGLPMDLLNGTIFNNYAAIGWIVLATIGIFSFGVILCIFFRASFYPFLIILQGVKICIFIFLQVLLLRQVFVVQAGFFVAAAALIYLGSYQYQKNISGQQEPDNA